MATTQLDIDAIAGELYALPREEFVAARNERAAQAKAAKDPATASAVKALPKPTVLVWALNQLAHAEQPTMRALFQTVEQLRTTPDVGGWKAISERYSQLVSGLAERAVQLTGSEARRGEFAQAIRTAATSGDRDAFREGRLTGMPEAGDDSAGWGTRMSSGPRPARGSGAAPRAADGAPKPATSSPSTERAEAKRALRLAIKEASAEHRELERDAAGAERAAAAARKAAERARATAGKAEARVEQLRGQLDDLG